MIYDFNPAQSEIILATLNERLRVESERSEKLIESATYLLRNSNDYPHAVIAYFYETTAGLYETSVGELDSLVEIGSKFAQREQLSGTEAAKLFSSSSGNSLLRLKRYRDLVAIIKKKAESKKNA